jgi:metal-responsive CopG/Arc/MetJ family transcriptional regulator
MAGKKNAEQRSSEPRNVLINLGSELLEEVNEFRFAQKFETRTEAIRWLIAYALKQKPRRT